MTVGLQTLHQGQPVKLAGSSLREAVAAVILLHGRGATADDILSLGQELKGDRVVFLAPQAAGHTWYPQSFLAPIELNQPFLSSALGVIAELLNRLQDAAIPADRVMLLGFSQGACLALEFAARNAHRYGGIIGLSGGLIGPDGIARDYDGSLDGTPVFLGCGESDPYIPRARIIETESVLQHMNAKVTRKLYPRLGHTVNRDELVETQRILTKLLDS